jgi:hypothetical protein
MMRTQKDLSLKDKLRTIYHLSHAGDPGADLGDPDGVY